MQRSRRYAGAVALALALGAVLVPAQAGAALTAPGAPAAVHVRNVGNDLGFGLTSLLLTWSPPAKGPAPAGYDVEQCWVPAGQITGCGATSSRWNTRTSVHVPPNVTPTTARSCPPGVSGCYLRVRSVDAFGGASAWKSVTLEPWAPFGVTVTPGRSRRTAVVKFNGPAESGPGANTAKHYRVFTCTTSCSRSANWTDTGLPVAYPPSGSAPFVAGTITCGDSHHSPTCQVRMQFVDGLGEPGNLSANISCPTDDD